MSAFNMLSICKTYFGNLFLGESSLFGHFPPHPPHQFNNPDFRAREMVQKLRYLSCLQLNLFSSIPDTYAWSPEYSQGVLPKLNYLFPQ